MIIMVVAHPVLGHHGFWRHLLHDHLRLLGQASVGRTAARSGVRTRDLRWDLLCDPLLTMEIEPQHAYHRAIQGLYVPSRG